jgi:hypothetical protein
MDRGIMRIEDKFTDNKAQVKTVTYLGTSILLIGGTRSLLAG